MISYARKGVKERPELKCEGAHLVEIVKLRSERRLVNFTRRDCSETNFFWFDEAAHECSTLQMFPGSHTHSMHIYLAVALCPSIGV